jgi:hypothetical protein
MILATDRVLILAAYNPEHLVYPGNPDSDNIQYTEHFHIPSIKYFNFPVFTVIPRADAQLPRSHAANAFGDTLSGAGPDVGN